MPAVGPDSLQRGDNDHGEPALTNRASATIHRIDERWFLSITWCSGVTEYIAPPGSWSAGEALVHGDLATYRSEHGRAAAALTRGHRVSPTSGAPGRIRTCAFASGGRRSIP